MVYYGLIFLFLVRLLHNQSNELIYGLFMVIILIYFGFQFQV